MSLILTEWYSHNIAVEVANNTILQSKIQFGYQIATSVQILQYMCERHVLVLYYYRAVSKLPFVKCNKISCIIVTYLLRQTFILAFVLQFYQQKYKQSSTYPKCIIFRPVPTESFPPDYFIFSHFACNFHMEDITK